VIVMAKPTPPDILLPKPVQADSSRPATPAQTICLRCRQPLPVDEDGFCKSCAKANEQACL
jgi:predicted amidophosphoribosyltransferase